MGMWAFLVCVFFVSGADKLHADSKPEHAPPLHSEAAVLIDAETGQVLADKNGDRKMYPASITKIATGIMALEKGDSGEKVTVSKNAAEVDGTSVYLLEGEKIELHQLVEGMLINSGNDAGTAVAEHISGSEQAFSREMTEYLKEKTGITTTSFTNPHGLFSEDHYSTAEDMARITQYAMKNDDFREIVSTKELEWKSEGWDTQLRNHHQLLWDYEGATGVKNGYVSEAGFTLVTSAKRGNRELIAVVMKADSAQRAYEDSVQLLDFGFDKWKENVLEKGERFQSPDHSIFVTGENVTFLSPEQAELERTVSDEGMLNVTDQKGNHIFTAELVKERAKSGMEKKKRAEPSPKAEEERQSVWKTWAEYSSMVADTLYYHLQYIL